MTTLSTRSARLRRLRATAPARFLDNYLPYLLGHASHELNKDFDRYVRAAGLTPLEWRTLATLTDGDGLTIGQLSRKVVAQQPTLTKTIKKLDEADLVRRADDAADLRKTRVFSTARGRAIAHELMAAAKEHETDLLRHLGSDDIAALKAALCDIISRSSPGTPAGVVRGAMKLVQGAQ